IQSFSTPTSSMSPTLEIKDYVLVHKSTTVEPGELVVFAYPCEPGRDYIKRMIAKGGDTVEVRCSVVYVNGKAIPNTLVTAQTTYDDRDEITGRWLPRVASRYRETLNGHTYDLFRAPANAELADFPLDRTPPSCANGGPSSGGAIVETKQDAAQCDL